jgi:hypothetical protein
MIFFWSTTNDAISYIFLSVLNLFDKVLKLSKNKLSEILYA